MIDPQIVRKNPDFVKEGISRKGYDAGLVDAFLEADTAWREVTTELQARQAERNAASNQMASATQDAREAARESLRVLSDAVKRLEREADELDARAKYALRQLPNIPASDVPAGNSDADNLELRKVGDFPKFDFEPKDHETILNNLGMLDIERGAKAAGSKFYYLKGDAVRLEMGLMRYAIDFLSERGFTAMTVPHLLPAKAFYGAGHFVTEEDAEDGDAYRVERDNLYLAGTAEVGLVSYHADEVLSATQLPLRYVGISPAYRREAGTYGKENRGLYRVHQFTKVEMVSLVEPSESEAEYEKLLGLSEALLQSLNMHYRVVYNCGADLGHPQVKKWDIECYMAGLGKYGETHSCSNDTDYQARSLGIRYRSANGETAFVHTLNNTAIASPRFLIAFVETHQQKDGSVAIPEPLVKYVGFDVLR